MKKRAQILGPVIAAVCFSAVTCVVCATSASPERPANSTVETLPAGLREDLILYYPFEKDDGEKAVDVSGKGKHGSVHGAKYIEDEDAGGAIVFDGDADYISVPDINLKDFTFAAWAKPPDDDQLRWQPIFLLKDGEHGYTLRADWDTIKMITRGDRLSDWHSVKNRWTHVAVTQQGRTFKLYRNGEAVGAKDMDGKSIAGTLYIGGDPNHKEDCWQGLIDEVTLYNRPLNEQEIRLLYDMTDFQGQKPTLEVSAGVIQDLQCFLRSDKPKYKADDIPIFKADVKGLRANELWLASVPSLGCRLEVDGTSYQWSGPEWIRPRGVIGSTYTRSDWIAKYKSFLRLPLAEWLWLSAAGGASLNLTPGKHTVRLAWAGYWKTPRQERPVKLLSNPVQIEILPSRGQIKRPTPKQKHRRQVVHAFHSWMRPAGLTRADRERGLRGDLTNSSDLCPNFGWDDIPILLELAESQREMKSTPSLGISSYIGGPCLEGMAALWLVEGLLTSHADLLMRIQMGRGLHRGLYDLPLNAICSIENGPSTELPRQSHEGLVGALESWWKKARSNAGQVHRRTVRAYQDWWRMVGHLRPEEAAAFHPLDLTDIRWGGSGRHDELLETYDQITPEGTVAHRTIYGPGRQVLRTVYYTLKHKPAKSSSKADYKKEMMTVQKVVLYFYDHNGNIVRAKSVHPASKQP
jgi:hypothetical protein